MRTLRWLLAAALALAVPAGLAAQVRGTVSGRVVEASSQRPLSGAQVRVAGTSLGTTTDEQGRFTITGIAAGARTLQVSRIGYQAGTAAVTVGAEAVSVTVTLSPDPLGLEEIVVVGYGEQRRGSVAGSVGQIKAEAIEDIPIPSIQNALQGRVAGVQVVQNSGTPGAAMTVRVRGSSSISAGNQPLYVIDGVPMTQGNFSGIDDNFGGQGIDALADLNPNEIESIEVLKDASAAAIYGSRASNGVVLITTKRGRAGRPEISFGSYYGTQQTWRQPRFLGSDDYIQVYNEGFVNRYGSDLLNAVYGTDKLFGYADDGVANVWEVKPGVNVDWVDEVLRPAPIANYEGSIAGGTERTRYYVGGSYFNQDGTVRGMAYDRLNGRVNLDYTATDRLTLGTNVSLTRGLWLRGRNDNNIYGAFSNALANPPTEAVYNEDGSYNLATTYANPVALSRENEAEERSIRILGNSFARYTFSDWLTGRVSLGLDQLVLRSRLYDSPVVGPATGSGGAGEASNSYVTKLTYEATANFNRLFADRHDVSGVVGTSYEDNTLDFNEVFGVQFPSTQFKYLNSAALITAGQSTVTRSSLLSYFGRASYTYDDRYTATFNVRADGSSKFSGDNRFGLFPSISGLWRVSEEEFFQGQDVLDDLALRASYGRTGNQAGIGDFASLALFAGGANYNDEAGIAPAQLPSADLRWETTDQLNVGADLGVLDGRLSLGVDYYVKKTNDLLVLRPLPVETGFQSVFENVGAMQNRGVELTATARWRQGEGKAFSWTTDLNLARNVNKVTSLLDSARISGQFASVVDVGQPLGVFYGHVTDGIFRSEDEVAAHAFQNARTAAGDIRFKDLNEDGVINDDDRTYIGSPWPELEGGLTNRLGWNGFDLSVFLQFSYGNEIFNANRLYTDNYGSGFDNNSERAKDRWTPENPDGSEPRAVWGDPNRNTRNSDRFVEDGSYLRIKNAVLGYNLPGRTVQRFGFSSFRVYLQGNNLITWTKYSGFDPEVNFLGESAITRGTDFYTLPQTRTLTAGFTISY